MSTPETVDPPVKGNAWLRPAIAIVLVATMMVLWRFLPVVEWIQSFLRTVESLGVMGMVLFGIVYIAATIFFVPGLILTVGAGMLFGVVYGTIAVSLASTIGATLAFLLGRYAMRDWVAERIANNPRFAAIDRGVANSGWKIVGLVRLSPIFPFNLINYAFGITKVSLREYVLASWIGMMPGTLMYVYLGSATGDLAAFLSGEREKQPAEFALYIVGLIVTIAVTVLVTRIARRALNETVDIPEEN